MPHLAGDRLADSPGLEVLVSRFIRCPGGPVVQRPDMLPVLTVNRSFLYQFMAAETPCGALGLVEESGRQSGFVALHLDEDIPSEVTAKGFRFRHSLLSGDTFEVIHLQMARRGLRERRHAWKTQDLERGS